MMSKLLKSLEEDYKQFDTMTIDDLDAEISLAFDNAYQFEQELRNFPKNISKYARWLAHAERKINDLDLEIRANEVILVKAYIKAYELEKKKDFPMSSLPEAKKLVFYENGDYLKAKEELNDAIEKRDLLRGLVDSWNSKGYRLMELGKLLYGIVDPKISVEDRIQKAIEE